MELIKKFTGDINSVNDVYANRDIIFRSLIPLTLTNIDTTPDIWSRDVIIQRAIDDLLNNLTVSDSAKLLIDNRLYNIMTYYETRVIESIIMSYPAYNFKNIRILKYEFLNNEDVMFYIEG